MRRKDYALFWQKFATMIGSGVPLVMTLDTLRREHEGDALGPVLDDVIEGLKVGERFSECLDRHPGIFGRDVVQIIRGGEGQGRLDEVATVVGEQVQAGVLSAPEDLEGESEKEREARPAELGVRDIIQDAVRAGASDVHIDGVLRDGKVVRLVRYRIDGVLDERHVLSKGPYVRLLSELKVWASLDVGEKRLPQDGGAQLDVDDESIRLRVSIGPCVYGESACIRILRSENVQLVLSEPERVFPEEELRERLFDLARRPYGLILCCGPTGSGKTTTAYSLLARQDATRCKVVSVEDPVEYVLPNVQHVSLRPAIGLSFAPALRWVSRMDPDVVFCSELRDESTAELLLRLGLTGHLVISQLHVTDGLSALFRLLDLGLEPYLVADALQAIVSQRLVRKLCPHCRIESEEARLRLEALSPSSPEPKGSIFESRGCAECNQTGFRGRRAVYELLEIDGELRSILHRGADRRDVENWLETSGTRRLMDGGLDLVRQGETSLGEVLRACPRKSS